MKQARGDRIFALLDELEADTDELSELARRAQVLGPDVRLRPYSRTAPIAARTDGVGRERFERCMNDNAESIRILCVDDHPVLRLGIAGLLAVQPDMALVGEASGREAIRQFRTHRPDIMLMDLQMPEMGGLDANSAITAEFPDARIIVLTTYSGDARAMRAMKLDARGYLLKNALHKELVECIRAVHAGRKALASEVSVELAEHATDDPLTPAEIRVLRLIAHGNANKEIARALTLSEETVKGQLRSILSKLGAKDRTHAAMIGIKRGTVEI